MISMNPFGDGGAAMKYTEEKLNGLDVNALLGCHDLALSC